MSCNDVQNSWDVNPDYKITFTGYDVSGKGWTVTAGEDQRTVNLVVLNAIKNLEDGDTPVVVELPVNVLDPDVGLGTSANYLNTKYPNVLVNSVIHNGVDYKFTKMTATKWEPSVMELI